MKRISEMNKEELVDYISNQVNTAKSFNKLYDDYYIKKISLYDIYFDLDEVPIL